MLHRSEIHRWYCTASWQRRRAHQLRIEPNSWLMLARNCVLCSLEAAELAEPEASVRLDMVGDGRWRDAARF
jgi:hypothetical protein